MIVFKVINTFKEKQHGERIYHPGESYPADGEKLNEKRAEFLTQVHPTYKVAFLEKEISSDPPKKNSPKKKSSDE